jgi:hypothetical protein
MKIKIALFVMLFIFSIFALWYGRSKQQENEATRTAYKAVKLSLDSTTEDYTQYRKQADSAIDNATATAIQNGEAAAASQAILNQTRQTVKALLATLNSSEKSIPDSTWVQVSPLYKWGCDSLRRVNAIQDELINQYEADNQAHVNSLAYETQIRDSALQKEREFSNAFRLQLIYCSDALSRAATPGRTQVYVGMAAWGNGATPLGGGEINLGMKTKNDQFFEIKGAYLGKWWVGVGTKFKISLK